MKTRKVKLADVLWDAANEWLPTHTWTCHATAAAFFGARWRDRPWINSPPLRFMRELGCPTGTALNAKGWELIAALDDEAIQGVRYMWLLLAMHVAEDEGVVIEVSA